MISLAVQGLTVGTGTECEVMVSVCRKDIAAGCTRPVGYLEPPPAAPGFFIPAVLRAKIEVEKAIV